VDVTALIDELDAWAEQRDPGWETIAYGEHADQVADLRAGGGRTAVVVHGGFWRPAFTRRNTRALAVDLARRGWTTWNIEYRRGGMVETLPDVATALQLTGRTTAIGHSAGGHLVLWAAAEGLVEHAVSLAGVADLTRAARERIGDGAAIEFAGEEPPAYADPMRRLPLPAPALLVHGTDDDRVPIDYGRAFAAAGGGELLELPRCGHFEPIDPRTPEWTRIVERL
jgi:pimeloyl-ACP methyl ester carboxylesterase